MKKTYLAPSLKIIQVKIEKGFATSIQNNVHMDVTIGNWNQDEVHYNGNAVKDNSDWGEVDW